MEASVVDVNTLLNHLAVFNQSITSSAANMKASFDAQIAGISKSFEAAFQAADAMTANSAANFRQVLARLICLWRVRMGKRVNPPAAKLCGRGIVGTICL